MGTGRVPDEKRGHEFVIAENGALPARRFSRSPLYFGIYLHFSITKKKKSLQSALWEDRAPRMFILVVVVGPESEQRGRRRKSRRRDGARGAEAGSRLRQRASGPMRPATSHPPRGAPLAFQRLRPVARLESQSCCVNETLELSNSPP